MLPYIPLSNNIYHLRTLRKIIWQYFICPELAKVSIWQLIIDIWQYFSKKWILIKRHFKRFRYCGPTTAFRVQQVNTRFIIDNTISKKLRFICVFFSIWRWIILFSFIRKISFPIPSLQYQYIFRFRIQFSFNSS